MIAAKANRVVGVIKRNFEYLDADTVVNLHCTLVRPILEYAVQSWCTYLVKDIDELEKVQSRMTKLVPGLQDMSSEARLVELSLPTLKLRRQRGDLIELYKILNGHEGTDYRKFFKFKKSITRGHQWKLEKQHINCQVRENWFTIRVINPWNKLPESIVNAPTISSFKSKLDKYLGLI